MKIEWGAKANRRNFPLFLDMIRGHAALFCLQRPRVGNVIFATRDDFEYAKDLYKRLGPKQKFKLGGPQITVLRALVSVKGNEISRNDIARKTGIPANTVYKILHGKDKDDDGLLGRIEELTFERVTKTYHDKDAGTSKGTTENLYVLGSHFNEFGLYDESDLVIELPEDAEFDIDYAHISSDFLTFPASGNVNENDSAVLESDIDSILHTYTTQQQQQTLTLPKKCVQGGTETDAQEGVCLNTPPYYKPGNLEKSENDNGDGARIESEIDNKSDRDGLLTFQNSRKVSPEFSVKTKRVRTGEDGNPTETYLRKCVAVIRSCKYAETQNKVSRDHFLEYVQQELADELHLSSDESAAYWGAVCAHPDVAGSIEELYGKEV
jgi:transcriptional regulator with XRE-family HTH domain